MSSGDALVESGLATVKSSCLSLQMKIIIGAIASVVIVTATVTPAVLLTGGSSGSEGQIGNSSSMTNMSTPKTTADGLLQTGEPAETTKDTDSNTTTLSHIDGGSTNQNGLQQTTPLSGGNINIGETSTSLNKNNVEGTTDPPVDGTDNNATTLSHINGGSTNQNGLEQTTLTSGYNINIGETSTSLNQNSGQTMYYQYSFPTSTTFVSTTTTPPPTTLPPCSSPYSQTLVFILYNNDQDRVYLRGGTGSFTHISLGPEFPDYDRLAVGDTKLDWSGREIGQPTEALGSPTAKTSNNNSSALYFPLNTFGNNYWVMNVCLDCSTTDWFEFKVYTNGILWENSINQESSCAGTAGARKATSGNHAAKCGKINVYTYGSNTCRIDNM